MTADSLTHLRENLLITELNYNPGFKPAPFPDGTDFFDEGDMEYIEFYNAGATPLNLQGLSIVDGIDFDFGNADITHLEPGRTVLLVKQRAAFESFYGFGFPVIGEWVTPFDSSRLSNGGETISFQLNGEFLFELNYDDRNPWPRMADGDAAMILIDPQSGTDLNDPANWAASASATGYPGTSGELVGQVNWDSFADVEVDGEIVILDQEGDYDLDSVSNYMEFAIGSDPLDPSDGVNKLPTVRAKVLINGRQQFEFHFHRRLNSGENSPELRIRRFRGNHPWSTPFSTGEIFWLPGPTSASITSDGKAWKEIYNLSSDEGLSSDFYRAEFRERQDD